MPVAEYSYHDVCRDWFVSEDDIEFDEKTSTWTVLSQLGMDAPLCRLASKDLALAIARALYAANQNGADNADRGWCD